MKRRTFIKITLPIALTGCARAEQSDKPQLEFGVIADPQYADADMRMGRFYRNSLAKMEAAVEELNKNNLEFVATLGDVIDKDIASFDDIMPIYEKLKAPQTFVLGNHDFTVDDKDKGSVMGLLGMEKSYFSETKGDWHFIYLDGTDVSPYRHPKNSAETKAAKERLKLMRAEKLKQAKPYSGAVGADQLTWFTAELEKAKATGKRVIVFNHFPVFPLNDGYNLWNDKDIVTLIARYPNVVAYMNGHQHKGNYTVNEGCHYLNLKGMVETADKSAFAIVRCYSDRIEVDGFETEPDRSCAFADRG
jgi:predicted phosphodiesterase